MLTDTTFLGCDMYGGAVSPDGSRLYCVEEFPSEVFPVDPAVLANAPGAIIDLGARPRGIAIGPNRIRRGCSAPL